MKNDVADCSRHVAFMEDQELGIEKEMMKKENANTRIVTQAYMETSMDFLRKKRKYPPWISMFTDAILTDDERKTKFISLSDGGSVTNENMSATLTRPFRSYITLSPLIDKDFSEIKIVNNVF